MWFWLFVGSVLTNLFVFLYIRWLLTSLSAINIDVSNISDLINDFSSHLKGIHELEMFYGDENLKSLIDHSSMLIKTLDEIDLMLNEKEEEDIAEAAETQKNKE
jgi:hypothetical protein